MILLLPVYRPGRHLLDLVDELRDADLHVVVVDDGSGAAGDPILDPARGRGCTVLRHDTNRGKGTALKTGFRHIADAHPGHDVVCADADGQHAVADILRVAGHTRRTGRMAVGIRGFEGAVPLRSKVGNAVTSVLFRVATGRRVHDTQSGLRAYPAAALDWLLTVPGERFEYEMNVLLHAARAGMPVDQIPVATTYVNDNASSHFGSLSDSARIYRPLLRSAISGLLASCRGSRGPARARCPRTRN
jgi:glycosyltransferase involved in cell wall biosynthesis